MKNSEPFKKLSVGTPLKIRGNQVGTVNKPFEVARTKFYNIYSDRTKKVRDIEIDYRDYKELSFEEIKLNISKNIARLRKEKGLTCEDIAETVEVSRQYISQIENAERNVTLEKLVLIAQALDVSIGFLISNNPFDVNNIYIDKLTAEIRKLEPEEQKKLCAEILAKLLDEDYKYGR